MLHLLNRKGDIMKKINKNVVLLLLNILCFVVVLIGSFIDDFTSRINIAVCVIIFIAIIVQIIAILGESKS